MFFVSLFRRLVTWAAGMRSPVLAAEHRAQSMLFKLSTLIMHRQQNIIVPASPRESKHTAITMAMAFDQEATIFISFSRALNIV